MTNVIRFPSHRIGPRRRVLFPSVVPFALNRSTPEARMAYAFLSLGLIVSCAMLAPMLAYYVDRFIGEDERR
jgi:hypothetical protein